MLIKVGEEMRDWTEGKKGRGDAFYLTVGYQEREKNRNATYRQSENSGFSVPFNQYSKV